MQTVDLQLKWKKISITPITSGFRTLRITSECICDLYVGVNNDGKRALLLLIPPNINLEFTRNQKENLSIEYFKEKRLIVLQLNVIEFNDLFDDLILSLYHGIKNMYDIDEYSRYFIQTFYRWSDFFEDKKSELLSEETIKGIFGEMLYLKKIIVTQNNNNINSILKSWTGPYDKGNDFELENKNIEVKTKSLDSISIRISSEFQLELIQGKTLELFIVSILNDFNEGVNIKSLIYDLKNIIQTRSGDFSIFLKALRQKNITIKNVGQYDGFKYKPVNWITYNCSAENFPKLNKSNVPIQVSQLKYNLNTNMLALFIIEKGDF
jgi:hypothetical protein